MPAVCIEARHAKAAMVAMNRNKNDRNDARSLAQLIRSGWFKAIHVTSTESYTPSRPTRARSARRRSAAAPFCRSLSCAPVACAPTSLSRDKASGASCGSSPDLSFSAAHATADSRTGGVCRPAPASPRAARPRQFGDCGSAPRSGLHRSRNTSSARSFRGRPQGSRQLRAKRRALPLSRQQIL